MSTYTCYRCGQVGHFASTCTAVVADRKKEGEGDDKANPLGVTRVPVRCELCDGTHHTQVVCPRTLRAKFKSANTGERCKELHTTVSSIPDKDCRNKIIALLREVLEAHRHGSYHFGNCPFFPRDSAGMSGVKGYRWTWTSFDVSSAVEFTDTMRYLVYQKERCPTTGRDHYQGYVEFKRQVRMRQAKRELGRECFLQLSRGTAEENRKYCTKLETRLPGTEPTEIGECAKKGGKNELMALRRFINEGATIEDVASSEFYPVYIRHKNNIEAYVNDMATRRAPRQRNVFVEVRWGNPGTGKTTSVFSGSPHSASFRDKGLKNWKDESVFLRNWGTGKWWDGYQGEPVLVLDDYIPSCAKDAKMLLTVLEGYKGRVEVKGSTRLASWKHVVITTNFNPAEWFAGCEEVKMETVCAIRTRIHKVTHFTGECHRMDPENIPPEYSDGDEDSSAGAQSDAGGGIDFQLQDNDGADSSIGGRRFREPEEHPRYEGGGREEEYENADDRWKEILGNARTGNLSDNESEAR